MSLPESTEFPPGMLPGAKVGMYSLFPLIKWEEVLCFTLKNVSVFVLLLKMSQ